jgi:hypothetical protein
MKISALSLVAILLASTIVSVADEPWVELWGVPGETSQGSQYEIFPTDPTINDRIYFTGNTDTITNAGCFYCEFGDAPPALIIDNVAKTVELEFYPVPGCVCAQYVDPVYGFAEGEFGPLSDGDWLFFCDHPSSSFSIPFHVSSIKILEPNGGESLLAGSAYTVSWEDYRSEPNCIGNYRLVLICRESSDRVLMDIRSASEACSYDWLLPPTDSNQCSIVISDINDPNVSDTTDAAFTIYQCRLASDLTGDCVVDFTDFATLTAEWLDCGNPFDPNCIQ